MELLNWHWPFNVETAKEWQQRMSLELTSDFEDKPLELIAGADIGLIDGGRQVRAAICVFNVSDLSPVIASIAIADNQMPYIPGLLAFREVPALCKAWEQLPLKPQLLLVDGQGIAHPRGFGNAAHLGWTLQIATIGVAKSRLVGEHLPLGESFQDRQSLMYKGKSIGWVLRSKLRCNPLYISPGNKVSVDQSLYWTRHCLDGYRLPKPTRFADSLASNRSNASRLFEIFPDTVGDIASY